MCQLRLELYYMVNDEEFARDEAQKLRDLVKLLTPHIVLDVEVLKSKKIDQWGGEQLPYHQSSDGKSQTLLIVHENIGHNCEGRGWKDHGCVRREVMEDKELHRREPSEDITIHEWIHTIQNQVINGRTVPFADDCQGSKCFPQTVEIDGNLHWYNWFRYCLGVPSEQISGLNLMPGWTLPPSCP